MKKNPREHLMEIAGRLFAERGYEAVGVREICQQARVNISAVNYYFHGKQNLYLEAVRTAARQRIKAFPLVTWAPQEPPEVKLRHFIRNMLQRIVLDSGPTWQSQLLMSEIVKPTHVCRRFVREFIRPNFQLLLEILRELLPKRCSWQRLHRLAFSIVGQCVYYRLCRSVVTTLLGKESERFLNVEVLARHIAEFSLAGLRALAPSSRLDSAKTNDKARRRTLYALDRFSNAHRRPS
jgi:AcrR family transcriptional regulator